jgi:pantoate--beta-alanine ligase
LISIITFSFVFKIYNTLKIVKTAYELQKQIREVNLAPVGFVPTMGALHEGHLSLVREAVHLCPVVIISIYVNPTQFNDKEDLKNYPRTLEADLEMLNKVLRGNDIVFNPDDKEIYPVEDKRIFHFGNLDNVMEAIHRPGHFNGVAQVVSRLFELVKPDIAVFGMKDFQQFAVIKKLVRQTCSNVEIIGHPVFREPDGLAMSSRNRLLDKGIREKASVIYETILSASSMLIKHDINYIKEFVRNNIENAGDFIVEYFEIVDDKELIPVVEKTEMSIEKRYFGCIAVKAGKIRLIDNIEFSLA